MYPEWHGKNTIALQKSARIFMILLSKSGLHCLMKFKRKYTSKQITTKEYTDRLKQLNEEMKHTEHSLKLIECSAKACRIQMKRTLEAVADALEYACKKEKNKASCAKQVKVRTIAASKIITPKQYLEAMSYTPKPSDK